MIVPPFGVEFVDAFLRAYYELLFQVRDDDSRGDAFQRFFADLMEKRYPGDFHPVTTWGAAGDLGPSQRCGQISRAPWNIGATTSTFGCSYRTLETDCPRIEARVQELRQQFEAAERLENFEAELDVERSQIAQRIRQDHAERDATLREAIVTFEDIASALYDDAGRLEIEESANGPEFKIRIQGDRSSGVRNMEIFGLDMTVMKLCSERGIGPGFLIHDSHLFDGVDERQVGQALGIAARTSGGKRTGIPCRRRER